MTNYNLPAQYDPLNPTMELQSIGLQIRVFSQGQLLGFVEVGKTRTFRSTPLPSDPSEGFTLASWA